MKVTILTVGTYGDVAPCVALGSQLKKEGHEVVIATHEKMKSLCERFSLKFSQIRGDLSVETPPEQSKELFEAKGWKRVSSFFKLMRLFYRVLDVQLQDCYEAAKGADLIIYHKAAFAGPHLAEHFKIPAVQMLLQPELPTWQHASCLVSMPKWMGQYGNYLGHLISQQFLWQIFRGKINQWRHEVLQLPKSPFWKPTTYQKIYDLVTFSPSLMDRPKDWGPDVKMVGFCRLKETDQWTPPKELVQFIESGVSPIYLGFGSLSESFSPHVIQEIIKVLDEKGIKTIVPANLPGLQDLKLPSHIFPIGYVPHDWLFPKVAAVIHHGGVGTLSAGLYAGKPTWIIPCIVDQFFFGEKTAKDWRVGPQPIAKVDFNREKFAVGLDQLLQNLQVYQEKATQYKHLLEKEDGVRAASTWIQETFY